MSGVLAIIPAGGRSERAPRHDARPFLGKPLVAHSVLQAWEATAVDRVVVSTDNAEIAGAADQYGAEVAWRPADIGGDEADAEESLVHVIEQITQPKPPRLVVLLRANAPLRRPREVQAAIETLEREGADSLFSATPLEGVVWRRRDGRLNPVPPDSSCGEAARADGDNLIENGSIYVFKPWVLRERGNPLRGKIAVHPMGALDSLRINEPDDFDRLERLARAQGPSSIPGGLGRIRLLVLDFDGVMTDNRVWVHQDGTESVACHRGDGMGIGRLKRRGVEILVISTETNPVVAARCRKLGLASIQGCDDKLTALKRVAWDRGLKPGQIAYVGNDVNDLECLGWVGTPIAVADALPEVLRLARLVTKNRGGHGAVREVTDWLYAACHEESLPLVSSSLDQD